MENYDTGWTVGKQTSSFLTYLVSLGHFFTLNMCHYVGYLCSETHKPSSWQVTQFALCFHEDKERGVALHEIRCALSPFPNSNNSDCSSWEGIRSWRPTGWNQVKRALHWPEQDGLCFGHLRSISLVKHINFSFRDLTLHKNSLLIASERFYYQHVFMEVSFCLWYSFLRRLTKARQKEKGWRVGWKCNKSGMLEKSTVFVEKKRTQKQNCQDPAKKSTNRKGWNKSYVWGKSLIFCICLVFQWRISSTFLWEHLLCHFPHR